MRTVVRAVLLWQRIEVLFAALLPLGLIVESSIANGWAYASGDMSDSWRLVIALGRGFFLEVFTYCAARLCKALFLKKQWFGCILMGVLAVVAVYVSAGNNFGWVESGQSLVGVLGELGQLFGSGVGLHLYELSLSMLLPIAVAGIALVDTSHLVHEALDNDHLDNRAVEVAEKEMHRTAFLKGQRQQRKVIEAEYKTIAQERAQKYIGRMRSAALAEDTAPSVALPSGSSAMSALPSSISASVNEVKIRRIRTGS
ncbi:MAG: hypothetical protein ACR2H5_08165 [Ktedonobacteraceae bacterium]